MIWKSNITAYAQSGNDQSLEEVMDEKENREKENSVVVDARSSENYHQNDDDVVNV